MIGGERGRRARVAAVARKQMRWSAATSRKPRFRPCAPIGGKRCAASPTSIVRRAAKRSASAAPRGKTAGRLSTRIAPWIECARASTSRAKRSSGQASGSLERVRPVDPDEAHALAGQRHQRERSVLGMELGRDPLMRMLDRQRSDERRLGIAPLPAPDACGLARARSRAVGGHRQSRRDGGFG